MGSDFSIHLTPKIADHKRVFTTFQQSAPVEQKIERRIWDFKQADWNGLEAALSSTSWNDLLDTTPELAASRFSQQIFQTISKFIPQRHLRHFKQSHPWLNSCCASAIDRKNQFEGSLEYTNECKRCSEILAEEHTKQVEKLKRDLATLPRGSKRWWNLNRELLDNKAGSISLPSLKNASGSWVYDAKDKADLMKDTFSSKFVLPPLSGSPSLSRSSFHMSTFNLIRTRWTLSILKKLSDDSATGPDLIPARVLKKMANALALLIILLIGKLL